MIPDNSRPRWAKTLDIHMLALLGGRQRSREEYAALLDRADFAFQRETDTRVVETKTASKWLKVAFDWGGKRQFSSAGSAQQLVDDRLDVNHGCVEDFDTRRWRVAQ